MRIQLTLLRCPDRIALETRRLEGGTVVLGRDPGADWALIDPSDRPLLSRRHCTLNFALGVWTLTDTSTNGTLLNGKPAPQGEPTRPLRDGDRLHLGSYEIEVALEVEPPAAEFVVHPFLDDPFGAMAPSGLADAPAVRLPDDFALDVLDEPPSRARAQPDHSPAQSDAFLAPMAHAVLPMEWDDPPATTSSTATPKPSPVHDAAASVAVDGALLVAFFEGAALPGVRPIDAVATMREAGAAFRAFVHGLRRALMARAEIKSTFRIDQTMIRSRRNNPLKFAAGDDDALAALLGAGRRADMTAAEAVEGALSDIRLHELATMAALQEAVRDLLAKLDPEKFRSGAVGGLLPARTRARAFDLYEAEFRTIRDALSEKFDDAFGRAFARAYERVVADLETRERLR